MNPRQFAILEQGDQHPQYEKTRAHLKELAQKDLDHDMRLSTEQHEGIGDFNSWILPIKTRGTDASFIMLSEVKSVLRGTHLE